MDRYSSICESLLRLAPDQYDATGTPNLDAINEFVVSAGFNPMTDDELAALWAEREVEGTQAAANKEWEDKIIEAGNAVERILDNIYRKNNEAWLPSSILSTALFIAKTTRRGFHHLGSRK